MGIKTVLHHIDQFESEAHAILGTTDSATRSRVYTVDQFLMKLEGLSIQQQTLFREALFCVQYGLFRAAHITAWQAFIDYYYDYIIAGHLTIVQNNYPKWGVNTKDDLLELKDFQIIEAGQKLRIFNKREARTLYAMLAKRNDCAHPSGYNPTMNSSLGYVDDLMYQISTLEQ